MYNRINDIIWIDWDPIGINDIAPRDEYRSYAQEIYTLLISGVGKETIARKLYEIETLTIGLQGSMDICRQVADKIIKIYPDI